LPSTLDAVFGWPSIDTADEAETQHSATETRIQECMKEQGFDYEPGPWNGAFFLDPSTAPILDPLKYAETWGFGYSTDMFGESMGQQSAVSFSGGEDANATLRESMTPTELVAWEEALYGVSVEPVFADGGSQGSPENIDEIFAGLDQGCQFRSLPTAIPDEYSVQFDAFMAELDERIKADPRLRVRDEEYHRCMVEEGYDFASEVEANAWVFEDLYPRAQEASGQKDPFKGMSNQEIDTFYAQPQEEQDEYWAEFAAGMDPEAVSLKAIQREEIQLAIANVGCAEAGWELEAEVRADVQAQMIKDNAGWLLIAGAEARKATGATPAP